MAVEAVISELVSAASLPCFAGKYSEIRRTSGLEHDNGPRLCIGNSIAYHLNSLNTKTGKPFA